jgi:pimeloyl-ACP methyl ester carboxylesterase
MTKPARRTTAWIAIAVGIAAATAAATHSHAATPFPGAGAERFSVTVTGSGPDVILIPGLASSAATWDGTVAHLKARYRLHVLNLAGFAGEPAGANATGDILPAEVEAIDAYIRANHLKPAVVGHSLGGTLTLMLAKAHPEDVSKIVVADALPYIGLLFGPTATVDAVKPQAAMMKTGIETAPADAFKSQETATLSRMVTSPPNRDLALGWTMASDRHVVAEALYEDMITDLRPDLGAIRTPAVLVYPVDEASGQDAAATGTFYKTSYNGLAGLTLVRIDNSRHFMMLDQPDAFNAALDAALK